MARRFRVTKTSIERKDPKTGKPKLISPWGVELTFTVPPVFQPVREDPIDISEVKAGNVVMSNKEQWHPTATLKEDECTVEECNLTVKDKGTKKLVLTELAEEDIEEQERVLRKNAFKRGILEPLRARMLPHDKGPFADNENGDIGKISWRLQQIKDLHAKIELIIKYMAPRLWTDPDGAMMPCRIQDLEHHELLNFVLDESPGYTHKSKVPMTAGRLLSQPREMYRGSRYRVAKNEQELYVLATAIIRACGNEAYLIKQVLPKDHRSLQAAVQDGMDPEQVPNPVTYGVAVFPDEQTMTTFSLFHTHHELEGMVLYSDYAVASMLFLSHADDLLRRGYLEIHQAIRNGTVTDEYVDQRIQAIRRRAEQAARFWEINPEIGILMARLDIKPVEVEFNKLQLEIDEKSIRKGRFGTGMKPADVEDRMKKILRKYDEVAKKHGGDACPPVLALGGLFQICINDTFKKAGLPARNVQTLNAYLDAAG